jgi:amino acid transporter
VGIRVLNHIINAAILIFVTSAANSDLYIGSRTLYGLAIEGKAPAIFKKVNRMGVPWPSLLVCTAFCCLVYLNVQSSGAKGKSSKASIQCRAYLTVTSNSIWLVRQPCIHVRGLDLDVHSIFTHVCFSLLICTTAIYIPASRFMRTLKVHGMTRDNLPYKAPMQPWGAWFALVSTAIITIFKGFDAFLPWNAANFIT